MIQSRTRLLRARLRHRKDGFSLIEILIVIALIAMLATLVIGNFTGILGGQEIKTTEEFVNNSLQAPMVAYKLDMGSYPSTEQGLQALVKPPSENANRWRGPYIKSLPEDPWGNPYQYRYPGSKNINGPRGYDVWSLGPDGVESGDDIGNWEN